MALVYNSGKSNQFTLTKAFLSKVVSSQSYSNYTDCVWALENLVPFNLAPFIQEFVNDNSKDFVYLTALASDHNQFYGFKITQQNDVITVKIASKNASTTQTYSTVATFNASSLPSTYELYFIYMNSYNTTESYVYVMHSSKYMNLKLYVYTRTSGGVEYKYMRIESSVSDVAPTSMSVLNNSLTPPYDPVMMCTHEEWFQYYPEYVFYKGVGFPSDGFFVSTTAEYGDYVSTDGEAPTPPVPPEPTDPNDEGDPSDEDGGDGDHEPSYDPVPVPSKPTYGAATAGFITMYRMTSQEMQFFATDMFSSNIWTALRNYFSSPMDFLVGINLLPFNPHIGGQYKPKYGSSAVFSHAYSMVDEQYIDIDCGSVQLTKYWGSCFDFEPYTKVQIWLPYIGYRDLPVDEIMGMTISVKYRCDCLTGDCVAFVYIGTVGETGPQVERIIAQFYGNCAVRIPFGGVSYDAAISNSIALVGAAASMGLSAGAGVGAVANGIGDVANVAAADIGNPASLNNSAIGVVQGMKPNVHKGGAAGASTGYMSVQKPYLIRRIPRQNLPSDYMKLKGYPSNIGGKLADFTGLAVVDDIQLNNIPAMEDERKEIMKWLKGGVLI